MIDGIRTEVLDNGLTVLAREDRSAPVAAVVLWVRSGYFHEEDEQAGLAHVCEHVYFNGTTNRPGPEDIAQEIKGLGGELNAGTYYHYTSYFVVLPADRLEQALDVQADAFANPLMDPAVLEKELGAIVQEARRKLDNPAAVARERMYAEAFDVHRMRRWRIGEEDRLRAYRQADLRRFWDDHYVPENVVVAVVGAVEPERAVEAVKARFGSLPARPLRREGSPAEPDRPGGLRFGRSPMDVSEVSFIAGLPTVPEGHPDTAPLDLLAAVLSGGRSSRLVEELRERRGLVSSVSAQSHQAAEIGLFDLTFTCEPASLEAAREALFEVLGRAWREPPSAEELGRARNAIRAGFVFASSTMLGQARALAEYEARGGHALIERELQALLAVEPEDVLRVARTYLDPRRIVIHEVVPEASAPAAPEAAALERRLLEVAGERPAAAEAVERTLPQRAPALSAGGASEGWSEASLGGGVRLVHRRNPGQPTVAVVSALAGGRRGDLEGRAGRARLGASLLTRGTTKRSASEQAGAIEALGAGLSAHVSDDEWGLGTALLTEHVETGAGLLFEALLEPAFEAEEIERARALQLQAVRRLEDQPLGQALELARQAAFGEALFGLPQLGTEESLERLDAEALRAWHRSELAGESLTLAVVGDLSAERARSLVERGLEGGRLDGEPTGPAAGAAAFREGGRRELARRKQQTAQALLFPGVEAAHEDAVVLDVLAACSSSLGGRFFEEIRTKRGLAYVVAAGAAHRRAGGWFAAFLATSPGDEEQARDVLLAEVRRLAEEPPAGAELERAVEYLCGRHALDLQGNPAQAGQALGLLGVGLGLDELDRRPERIRKVTSDRLSEVAARYLDPERFALGLVRGGD